MFFKKTEEDTMVKEIGVIAVLMAVVGYHVLTEDDAKKIVSSSQKVVTMNSARAIVRAIEMDKIINHKKAPSSQKEFLIFCEENIRTNRDESIVFDAWEHPFVYKLADNDGGFFIISAGEDGSLNTNDDIRIRGG